MGLLCSFNFLFCFYDFELKSGLSVHPENESSQLGNLSHCLPTSTTTEELNSFDTIRYRSLTWTRKLSIKLNLAHVARN